MACLGPMSYPTFYQKPESLAEELTQHLKSWGLRQFSDEASYYQWQNDVLAEQEIAELNRLGLARGGGAHPDADKCFYDLSAKSHILPALYSERYDYYLEIGCAITDQIQPAHRVLDFGCGVGILTTFYARCFPYITFIGVDRSPQSIARAREEAAKRGISNVQFGNRHIPEDDLPDSFDLIISTQSLFQAEGNPGLPSLNWKTFDRADDPVQQVQGEIRTGLKDRLDSLSKVLTSDGRMLLCEKAWHLGRRVLLQRALESRGYRLVRKPVFFRYRAIDEMVQEGPLFVVSRDSNPEVWRWCEAPISEAGESLYKIQGERAEEFVSCMTDARKLQTLSLGRSPQESSTVTFARWRDCLSYGFVKSQSGFRGVILGSWDDEEVIHRYFLRAESWTEDNLNQVMARIWPSSKGLGDEAGLPIYESHTPVAQKVWMALPDRHLTDEATFREEDGREMHIEWGSCGALTFLYWANTYDQRQLVLMPPHRARVLRDYYQESIMEMERNSLSINQEG